MRRPPRYCHWKRDRKEGSGFWYFERRGFDRVRLPGLPWSPEFMAAYERARKAPVIPGESETAAGTLNALIVAYYGSSAWRALKPSTRRTYRNILEHMRAEHGGKRVAMMERKHIRAIVEAKSGTPAAANRWLSLMVILLDLALDLEWPYIKANVARTVNAVSYKKRGFHTWTDAEISQFRAHWPIGSRERLALELLLGTAQRSGDVRAMKPSQFTGEMVSVRQEKTDASLEIPLLPELKEAMAAASLVGKSTELVTGEGKPFTEKYFYIWFKRACKEAGIGHCCPHGLRKAAAVRLALADCTTKQIQSITGHATAKEVERYTRAADQKRLAKQAYGKLGGTSREQET